MIRYIGLQKHNINKHFRTKNSEDSIIWESIDNITNSLKNKEENAVEWLYEISKKPRLYRSRQNLKLHLKFYKRLIFKFQTVNRNLKITCLTLFHEIMK